MLLPSATGDSDICLLFFMFNRQGFCYDLFFKEGETYPVVQLLGSMVAAGLLF